MLTLITIQKLGIHPRQPYHYLQIMELLLLVQILCMQDYIGQEERQIAIPIIIS